jgi:alkanesulfonate monooxygenase SsuD/methylene tetrahydromethanopterin reductase-like flavin-dependent oxidoreductase (luciferase family)
MRWKYEDMEDSAGRSGSLPAPPVMTAEYEEKLRAATLLGSGDQIAGQIDQIREAAGVELDIVARSYFPTLDYTEQLEVLQQLAEEVAPLI